jgi:hypothetical protein
MTYTPTTFVRVTLEYERAHQRAPLEAITKAIRETSRLSDGNAVVVPTAGASLAVLTGSRLLRGAR